MGHDDLQVREVDGYVVDGHGVAGILSPNTATAGKPATNAAVPGVEQCYRPLLFEQGVERICLTIVGVVHSGCWDGT